MTETTTRAAAVAALMLTLLAACDGGGGSAAGPQGRELSAVTVSPHAVTLNPGATQQFSTTGRATDGTQVPVEARFTVTAGQIDAEGLYTAPATPGDYLVIAQTGELYDTAHVTIAAPTVQGVTLTPATATVQTGGSLQFTATARYGDATTGPLQNGTWTATGGTVSATGLYTAGATAGTFSVIVKAPSGVADTSTVTVSTAPPPALTSLSVTPGSASVVANGSVQFTATGTYANGSTAGISATWTVNGGGSVSQGGLFTAGTTAGTYRVTASAGGVSGGADVTVTAAPPPSNPGTYRTVVGDDWQSYTSKTALRASQYFWWFDSANRDVYNYVDLVQDPTMGQVARITFPANTGESGSGPRITRALPAPVGDMWYRFKMKYQPGWTDVGPDPSGWANSYKVAFFTWETGFGSRGELELSNGTEYITGVGVTNSAGSYLQYTETLLPGSAQNFGTVSTEWSDGEWWEYVIHYKKTGSTSALYQYWRRRLTTGGKVSPGSWTYFGMSMSGSATPRVASVDLGCNKNKNNPTTMYIYWGPWEVVDGSAYPNPFSMPNAQ